MAGYSSKAGNDTLKEVNDQLDKGLKEIFESNRYKELLRVAATFHHYSINNQLMIFFQKPDAEMVKGFRQWQQLGRNVNKGEKSIKILAPVIKKIDMDKIDKETGKPILDKNGKPVQVEQPAIVGFKKVSVFDINQTNGKELPRVRDFVGKSLQEKEEIAKLYRDFKDYINKQGKLKVFEGPTDKGVGGWFNRNSNEIKISTSEKSNDTEKFKTLVHEYAHSQLHGRDSEGKDLPRAHKEAQAESTAFIVSAYYGLDTSDSSAGYIATWANDPKLARQAMGEIQQLSCKIIDTLNELQTDKIQAFYQENEQAYTKTKESFEKIGVNFDKLDKTNSSKNPVFELLQKDTGNVLSGQLEYSDKGNNYYLRSYKHTIIPLTEVNPERLKPKEAKYVVLNPETKGEPINIGDGYVRVAEAYHVAETFKDAESGTQFAVVSKDASDFISQPFGTRAEAEQFLNRADLSQSLHEQASLSRGEPSPEVLKQTDERINTAVSTYFGNKLAPTGDSGRTIGWELMRNPQIQNISDLKQHIQDVSKLPGKQSFINAVETAQSEAQPEKKSSQGKHQQLELER